jgi:hypothetical protein
MGTFAAALAADRNLPAVWLTPVLRAPSETVNDLRRANATFLLVGSAADPSWYSICRGYSGAMVHVPRGEYLPDALAGLPGSRAGPPR